MKGRWPWQLLVAALLVVLLATLATFQYRWLGEVSQAEGERMRASVRTRAMDFTHEFDSELTRAYVAFHVDGDKLNKDPVATLADAYAQWQSSSVVPDLVRDVYLVDGRIADPGPPRRFDSDRRVLEAVEWPTALAESLARARHEQPQVPGLPPPLLLADAIDSRVPALFVSVPFIRRIESLRATGHQVLVTANAAAIARIVVVVLDADTLQRQLLEPLVTKYFGDRSASEYVVSIVRRDEPATLVYNSGGTTVEAAGADVATGMFDLRMDELNRIASARGLPIIGGARFLTTERMAITFVRRGSGPDGKGVLMSGGDDSGAWQVRVRHRNGSLDAIVAQSRRRNLAISLGVLGLLAASVVLIIAAAQRQQRLARQQMEFVAAVSHELRTPLAVICSAGENLADGVVADGPQVKRYGTLIESEGRRLHDMVERVLEFAGVTSGAKPRPYTDVDLSRVIADAVGGLRSEARDRGVAIDVHSNRSLPPVRGDADALRSAVQNIVGNAVKYSASGATVDVGASINGSTVQLRVADRGLGIDAADLPHIFKPFHRGRRAVEAQIRGTGVGLSVVRHVLDAHHGDVRVESRPGEGTTVFVTLPVSDLATPHSQMVSDTPDTSDTSRTA
jgi:signal transduction histidine kinase